MSGELTQRKFRSRVPEAHRASIDTRLVWLWNQRFGTVQTVWRDSPDTLDKTAATLILQAILVRDLESIRLLFLRIEGGPQADSVLLDRSLNI